MKQREIKFRAFVNDRMGQTFNPFDPEFMAAGGTFSDDTILMQWTGLHDKNGKEIYEGDVMKINDGINLLVTFEDGKFCFDNTGGSYGRDFLGQDRVGRLEVIGNCHQNPELLK